MFHETINFEEHFVRFPQMNGFTKEAILNEYRPIFTDIMGVFYKKLF